MPETYTCPICGNPNLQDNPAKITYEICEGCGVEFGYEDPDTYPQIKERWIAAGRPVWKDTYGNREMWTAIWGVDSQNPQ